MEKKTRARLELIGGTVLAFAFGVGLTNSLTIGGILGIIAYVGIAVWELNRL